MFFAAPVACGSVVSTRPYASFSSASNTCNRLRGGAQPSVRRNRIACSFVGTRPALKFMSSGKQPSKAPAVASAEQPDVEAQTKGLDKKNMAGVATVGRTAGEEFNRRAVLAVGDTSVFLSFAYIGRGFHAGVWVPDVDMLITAAPFVAGWFLSAPLTGAYKPESTASWGGVAKYTGLASVGALLAGMGLRSAQLGHAPPTSFVVATGVYTLLVLGLWRSLYSLLERKGESKTVRRARGPFAVLEMVLSLIKRW